MFPKIEIMEVPRNSVTITADEYADLQASRVRLEILTDYLEMQKYSIDKEEALIMARGKIPTPPPPPSPDTTVATEGEK